jgi:D-ribose pyranase
MKNTTILNPQLSRVIAEMGHTDLLVIADAGLPLPIGVERIDLSLKPGVPGFIETLETVLSELVIEGATVAEEMRSVSPDIHARIEKRVGLELAHLPHAQFKELTHKARAIVRTGECTPYCNIILQAGVHDDFKR